MVVLYLEIRQMGLFGTLGGGGGSNATQPNLVDDLISLVTPLHYLIFTFMLARANDGDIQINLYLFYSPSNFRQFIGGDRLNNNLLLWTLVHNDQLYSSSGWFQLTFYLFCFATGKGMRLKEIGKFKWMKKND